MTVLVGILCQGGAVIGADSSATFSAGSLRTVEQLYPKLFIINEQVILAAIGSVGLAQRFHSVVETAHGEGLFDNNPPLDIAKAISARVINDFRSTHLSRVDIGGLVAFPYEGNAQLIEFEQGSFQPELKTDRLWYVSLGSGQPIADPFLGLMRNAFFPNHPPNLSTGIFISAWTLHHTIDVNPGGIKDPFHLAVLQAGETGKMQAEILDEKQMQEHQSHVQSAYDHLASFADRFTDAEVELAPEPPEPPKPPE